MLMAIFVIITIIFYCKMPTNTQLGILILNILIPDSIPYIDEIVMLGIYLAGKMK